MAKLVRAEDFEGRMLISSDLEEHRKQIQRYVDLGFHKVYLHNVGRNQAEWIEAFGREVLPKLTA
jgi:coenzyme F420-dependent glucose-6-phosphate dehydrogenase